MSTEYTPSTNDVREVWTTTQSDPLTRDTANSEFNRWLSKVRAEAWDECVDYAPHTTHERKRLKADNPYRGE